MVSISGIKAGFWRSSTGARSRSMHITNAALILNRRFPFMNIIGLVETKSLKVSHFNRNIRGKFTTVQHQFFVSYKINGVQQGGLIEIHDDPLLNSLLCVSLFPNFPKSLKSGLGRTLFALILLKGNSSAGRKVAINEATDCSKSMAVKMASFMPRISYRTGEDFDRAVLTVPSLSERELAAVEWCWKNLLHLEAE